MRDTYNAGENSGITSTVRDYAGRGVDYLANMGRGALGKAKAGICALVAGTMLISVVHDVNPVQAKKPTEPNPNKGRENNNKGGNKIPDIPYLTTGVESLDAYLLGPDYVSAAADKAKKGDPQKGKGNNNKGGRDKTPPPPYEPTAGQLDLNDEVTRLYALFNPEPSHEPTQEEMFIMAIMVAGSIGK